MKRLLLVDDDACVIRAYRDRLSAHGFHVNTAASGRAAMSMLRSARPDLVVLDLMMPEVSGVEVLKFIRSEQALAQTPVVLLTNDYRNDLGRHAARLGVEKALLKDQCDPSALMAVVDEILKPAPAAPAPIPAEAERSSSQDEVSAAPAPPAEPKPAAPVSANRSGEGADTTLLAESAELCGGMREVLHALVRAPEDGPEQERILQDLYCQVHFLNTAAGAPGLAQLGQTAAAFRALLYVLMKDPKRLNPSVIRTLENLVELVELLFQQARARRLGGPISAQVLVVDGDQEGNELAVSALSQVQVQARSTVDAIVAWQWLNCEHFDLVLANMDLPVLSGLELCKRLRGLAGYERTPVIFLADSLELQSREMDILKSAGHLMVKPILPQEVAAKVVMRLIRAQVQP